jgi:hypothetical protein
MCRFVVREIYYWLTLFSSLKDISQNSKKVYIFSLFLINSFLHSIKLNTVPMYVHSRGQTHQRETLPIAKDQQFLLSHDVRQRHTHWGAQVWNISPPLDQWFIRSGCGFLKDKLIMSNQ